MPKILRIIILAILIVSPIVFYKALNRQGSGLLSHFSPVRNQQDLPKIALIFDDFGDSLSSLKEVYSLDIPLTISVIPNLKFSKNIAHIGSRCGFSIFIHLPLEPEGEKDFASPDYRIINNRLKPKEVETLMRQYLNSIRIAIGVNNHMGSKATQDVELMTAVLRLIKKRGLIFVDSRTSPHSVAYDLACREGLTCGYNEGFLDSDDDNLPIEKRMQELIIAAEDKGKIIVIAHPRKKTIKFLKKNLPALKDEVDFVTIKDYFNL